MFRTTILLWTALAATVAAQTPSKSGIDPSNLDTTCKPCQDFWRYANGGWIDKNPIPARYARWGTLPVINEANRERLHTLLEAAAKDTAARPGTDERKIGDFYAACVDTEAIDALGDKPIRKYLDQIAAIKDNAGLSATLLELQYEGAGGIYNVMATQDLKNSKAMIASVGAFGISLPDRDYYFRDDARTKMIREEFLKHVQAMLQLLGDSPESAAAGAKTVMAFETTLAKSMMTNVQRRDPYSRYHMMDLAGVTALAPSFNWKALLNSYDIPVTTPINVGEPDVLKTVESQMSAFPLDGWKTWLRWRAVNTAAPMLSKPFRDESFHFQSGVLAGVKEQEPRWQQCANTIDRSMGDALGRMFVDKYFPPAAKQRMKELVENLRATLRDQLENADWLAPETRQNAVTKLNAFVAKIGYPDRWRDYSKVIVKRDDFFGDVRGASLANRAYQIAKIGKPIDRNDWGMTPPTVNAYYSPTMNEIVFPAGIMQPPLFDMAADDAVNYGAIGAVIGHEMGHGFDDQGSKFDAEGNLKNWWTDEDRKKFEERAACVIDQFNTLDVGEGLHHNGKLVVGEAMGDLGGLKLAYYAWKRSLRGKPEPPAIDGFTPDQRFFLAFARVWASVDRPESMRLRLNTDPHPLPKFRANGTLQNMPEFQKAFHCQVGDPMVRPPDKQCRLW
jgi:putative endopeptidase